MCAGAPVACPLRRFRNSPAFRRAVVQREPGGARGANQRFFFPNNTPSDLRLKQADAHAADGFALAIRRCSKYHIYTSNKYASTIYCGCVFLSKKPCQAIDGSSNAVCARSASMSGPGGARGAQRLRMERSRLLHARFRPWQTKRTMRMRGKTG